MLSKTILRTKEDEKKKDGESLAAEDHKMAVLLSQGPDVGAGIFIE